LFTFAVPGYNMRSTEINAVLGLEQIRRLDYNVHTRQQNFDTWINNLDSEKYYTKFADAGNSNFALPLILAEGSTKKDVVCAILEEEKVEYRLGTAGGGNQARQPYLKNYEHKIVEELKNSNYIHDYGLYIGNHTDLSEQQIKNLCARLNDV